MTHSTALASNTNPIQPEVSTEAPTMQSEAPTQERLSRRSMIKATGAALLGAVAALTGIPLPTQGAQSRNTPTTLRTRPNILMVINDQERYPRHWPAGWADTNLPNRKRIANKGLSFTRAFCNSCMCSPSRSTLFTGVYPAQHGVTSTLTFEGSASPNEPQLPRDIQNMAKMLVQCAVSWEMAHVERQQ